MMRRVPAATHRRDPSNARRQSNIDQSSQRVSQPPETVVEHATTTSKQRFAANRREYRVSWRRTDRPLERRSKIFQFRKPAERYVARIGWWYDDVRLEQRTVGEWRRGPRSAEVTS